MSALKEFVEKHVGMYAAPDGVTGGPFEIVAARVEGDVIYVTLDVAGERKDFKAENCVITKTKGR